MSTVPKQKQTATFKRKRFSTLDFAKAKRDGDPIVMITAYDSTSAKLAEKAGTEVILVGDSVAMVCLGHSNTLPVTLEEMLHHSRAVSRACRTPYLIGDMPFLSYHGQPEDAVINAGRFLKEAGMDAVKLEGGRERAAAVRAISQAGIPVIGHLGLTPQKVSALGGFRSQARTASAASQLLDDAMILQEAGAVALVLESVPQEVAETVTQRLEIPTIGIGAGVKCDGQVLVWHDLLGLDEDFLPPFAKSYRKLGSTIVAALQEYSEEVKSGQFPTEAETRHMKPQELKEFRKLQSC